MELNIQELDIAIIKLYKHSLRLWHIDGRLIRLLYIKGSSKSVHLHPKCS